MGSNLSKSFFQLREDTGKTAVFAFGRLNPPTTGHELLVKTIEKLARKHSADPFLYLSHSENPKKDPLPYNLKVAIAKKAFGKLVQKDDARTVFDVAYDLRDKGYTRLILVAGSDRVPQFKAQFSKYVDHPDKTKTVGKHFDVISAGERDPDAEDVSGMSASKMRALATSNEFGEFRKGVPSKLNDADAKKMYMALRKAMKIREDWSEFDWDEYYPEREELVETVEVEEKFTYQRLMEQKEQPTFLILCVVKPEDSTPQEYWLKHENVHIVYVDKAFTHLVEDTKLVIHNYNGENKSLSVDPTNTFAIPLGSVLMDEGRMGVAKAVEQAGVPFMNSMEAMEAARNKLSTARILQSKDVATPRTAVIHSGITDEVVETLGGKFPMMLKTITGSKGKGVMKMESLSSLRGVVDAFSKQTDAQLIAQEFFDLKYDVRVICLEGEARFGLKRNIAKGDFRTNVDLGGDFEAYKPSDEMKKLAEKATHALGMRLSGVDIAVNRKGELTVLEVNGSPGVSAKYYDIANKNDIDGKQLIETLYEFYSDKSNWSKQSVPIGVIEPVGFAWGEMMCKMDTGNSGSATLDARDLKLTKTKAIFKVGDTGKMATFPIKDYEVVMGAVGTDKEKRPVVEIPMNFKGKTYKVNFSLSDRSHMGYPVLMGTEWMKENGFIVDPRIRNEEYLPQGNYVQIR